MASTTPAAGVFPVGQDVPTTDIPPPASDEERLSIQPPETEETSSGGEGEDGDPEIFPWRPEVVQFLNDTYPDREHLEKARKSLLEGQGVLKLKTKNLERCGNTLRAIYETKFGNGVWVVHIPSNSAMARDMCRIQQQRKYRRPFDTDTEIDISVREVFENFIWPYIHIGSFDDSGEFKEFKWQPGFLSFPKQLSGAIYTWYGNDLCRQIINSDPERPTSDLQHARRNRLLVGGRAWFLSVRESRLIKVEVLSINIVAFVINYVGPEQGSAFINRFGNFGRRGIYEYNGAIFSHDEDCPVISLQNHIRYFSRQAYFIKGDACSGLRLRRMQALIEYWVSGEKEKGLLVETVAAVSLRLVFQPITYHTVLVLAENCFSFGHRSDMFGNAAVPSKPEQCLPDQSMAHRYGLRATGKFAGVSQFLVMMLSLAKEWKQGWTEALDIIDKAVNYEMDLSFDDDATDQYIFDDSFQRSRLYFVVLQFLRTASNMVHETRDDWNELHQKWLMDIVPYMAERRSEGLEDVNRDWIRCSSLLEATWSKVERRIEWKTEEVKSLRDGLFNATSLREATRSMGLNRALYVFTIVTVLYTPIGFMATFWALPFLTESGDSGGGSEVPSGFMTTFIVVPLVTYALCAFGAWFFSGTGQTKRLKRKLQGLLRSVAEAKERYGMSGLKREMNDV